jgi:Phage protein
MSAQKRRPKARVNQTRINEVQAAYFRMEAQRVASTCGVSLRTASRWLSGKARIPYTAQVILSGDLEPFGGEEWRGWRAENGVLIAPNGLIITKADLEAARRLGLGSEPPTLPPLSSADNAEG